MSDNYRPEIVEVFSMSRDGSPDSDGIRGWETHARYVGQSPDALLVRGVPMVGERVLADNGTSGEVAGVTVRVMVTYRDGVDEWRFDAKKVSPAPHEGDVKRVRDALAVVGCDLLTDNEIRVAIRAMKAVEDE